MHPFLFRVLGRDIPTFGIMMLIGIGAGLLAVTLLCNPSRKNRNIRRMDMLMSCGIAVFGALFGASMLRPLMKLPEVIIKWDVFGQYTADTLLNYLFGEKIFYGGLIGGALAMLIFCKSLKIPLIPMFDAFAIGVPLGQAFGRVGCLMAGCCYGVKVDSNHPFAIVYPQISLSAPPGVPLLAIPVIEAVILLVISTVVGFTYIKSRAKGLCVGLYLSLYAIARFILEFFRGDVIRGMYGLFSTSQYISFGALVAGGLFLIYANRSRKEHINIYRDEGETTW